MNILLFFSDQNNAVYYHRLILPFQHMKDVKVRINIGRAILMDLVWADVMIFSRVIDNDPYEVREIMNDYNIKLIIDFDDHYKLPPNHILYSSYQLSNMARKQQEFARIADQVWVTNKRLASVFQKETDEVYVIPNAIPFGMGQFTEEGYIESDRIRFFYAGGKTHQHDIELLEKTCIALRKDPLFKQIGQMVLGGYKDDSLAAKFYWDKIENIWSGKRPQHPTYQRLRELPVQSYMDLYNSADVALIPLEDNHFNRCKSNLKVLEAAAKKIPAICSRVETFTDNEPPVRWVYQESDWLKHIQYYLNNPMQIIEDGEKLHLWAMAHHNMADMNFLRSELLNKLVGQPVTTSNL